MFVLLRIISVVLVNQIKFLPQDGQAMYSVLDILCRAAVLDVKQKSVYNFSFFSNLLMKLLTYVPDFSLSHFSNSLTDNQTTISPNPSISKAQIRG